MKGHECYHCKQWIAEGEAHDCWTTTESALTRELSEDLRDAYERLRETAVELGDQRVYASHKSIMFSRKSCYFFVRPKRSFLEVVLFLGRAVKSPMIKKVVASSKTKRAHLIQIRHRDEVEAPLTDWMREAYDFQSQPAVTGTGRSVKKRSTSPAKPAKAKHAKKKAASKSKKKR